MQSIIINALQDLKVPCNDLIWWQFCKKTEHISPEQPYRLGPESRAQITRDNSDDISFDINHISPCISREKILKTVLNLKGQGDQVIQAIFVHNVYSSSRSPYRGRLQ